MPVIVETPMLLPRPLFAGEIDELSRLFTFAHPADLDANGGMCRQPQARHHGMRMVNRSA